MKGKTMKLRYIFYGLTSGLLFGLSSCSLNYEPLDTYSDVTEGVTNNGTKIVFKDKAAVESHLTTLYNQMRDRQEHWYVDLLLISDSHADNAYAGTTGAEVVPFENNSIEGSNSVMERDWNRYLEDIARANKLICNIDLVTDNSLTTTERAQYKAEAKIFRAMIMFDMVRLWGDFPVIQRWRTILLLKILKMSIHSIFRSKIRSLRLISRLKETCWMQFCMLRTTHRVTRHCLPNL